MKSNNMPMIAMIKTLDGTFSQGLKLTNSDYQDSEFYSSAFIKETSNFIFLIKPGSGQQRLVQISNIFSNPTPTGTTYQRIMLSGYKAQSLITDGTASGSVASYIPPGFFMAGTSTSTNRLFVAHITSTFTISWEIFSQANTAVSYSPEELTSLSLLSTTLFGCGKANQKAVILVLQLQSTISNPPSNSWLSTRALKDSAKGCLAINGYSSTEAYALIGHQLTNYQVYIVQVTLQSAGSAVMTFKRYSGLAQTFSYANNFVKMGLFQGNNVFFSGTLEKFSGSALYSDRRGFLMRFPFLQTDILVTMTSGETCLDYYVQYFDIEEESVSNYDRTSVSSSISTTQTISISSGKQAVETTLSIQDKIFQSIPSRISCSKPSCTGLSITPVSSSKTYTITDTFTPTLLESAPFIATDASCPLKYTHKVSGKSPTSSAINVLFKIFDVADYKKKAYVAYPTNDLTLANEYTIQIDADFVSEKKVSSVKQQFSAKYQAPVVSACSPASISVSTGVTFPQKTFQETISSSELITYINPFSFGTAQSNCFTYKLIEETTSNDATLPSYLSLGKSDFQIQYNKIETQTLTSSSIIHKYRYEATNKDTFSTIVSTQIVSITINHLCHDVQLQAATDVSTYHLIGDVADSVISVQSFALNPSRISCGSFYSIQHANNGSTILPTQNWFYSFQSNTNDQVITFKKHSAITISPGTYLIKLKGNVYFSAQAAAYTFIKITVCGMQPNPQNIDVFTSNATLFLTKEYQYTVGDPVLKIQLQQFVTDAICSTFPIQLSFKLLLSIQNPTYQILPSFIKGYSNTQNLIGGSIDIQTNTRADILNYNPIIAVEGSFLATPSVYLTRLLVPLKIITINRGPPIFSNIPLKDIVLNIKDIYQIQFGSILDPDAPDDSYKVNIDFGGAGTFISGLFPNFLVNPKSNATDPGVYIAAITLTDSNPDPQSSKYSFKITVNPLPAPQNSSNNSTDAFNQAVQMKTQRKQRVKTKPGQKDLEANIQKITAIGQVIVSFNQKVLVPGNFTQIGEDVLHIRVLPGVESNSKLLQIASWNVTNYTSNGMIISIRFENPLAISLFSTSVDKIEIEIIQYEFFQSAVQPGLMLKEGTRLIKILPKQMQYDGASLTLMASGGTVSSTLNSVMYANLGIQVAMQKINSPANRIDRSASMQMLWGLVNVMQLVVQLPLLNITFPHNAATFYSFIANVSSFELLPTEAINQRIFNFTNKEEEDPNFNSMGIETDNVVQILGSMFMYVIGFFIMAAATLLLSFFKKCHRQQDVIFFNLYISIDAICSYLSKMLFFNLILRLILEGYMDFALSTLLNIQNVINSLYHTIKLLWKTPSDIFASAFTILALASILILPFIVATLVWTRQKQLREKSAIDKYGAVYNELRIDQYSALLYNVIYMLRRLMIAALAIYFKEWCFAQVQIIIFHCILIIWYILSVRPFENPLLNKLEIFNEVCIILATYHLLIFNDFVPDLAMQYTFGWSMIGVSLLNIIVNVLIMAKESMRSLKLVCQVLRWKIQKYFKKKVRKEDYQMGMTQQHIIKQEINASIQEEEEKRNSHSNIENDFPEMQETQNQKVDKLNQNRRLHKFDSGQILLLHQMEAEHAKREKDRLKAGIGFSRHLLRPDIVQESMETQNVIIPINEMPGRGWGDRKQITIDQNYKNVLKLPPFDYNRKRKSFSILSDEDQDDEEEKKEIPIEFNGTNNR